MGAGGERYRLAVAGRGLQTALPGMTLADVEAEYDVSTIEEPGRALPHCILVAPARDEDVDALLARLEEQAAFAELPRIVLLPSADGEAAGRLEGGVHACLLPGELTPRVLRAMVAGAAAARAALQESEARLRTVQAVAGVGTMIYEWESDTLTWDERACEIFGTDDPHMPLREAFRFIHPDDLEAARAVVHTSLEAAEASDEYDWDAECRLVRPDGSVRTVRGRTRIYRQGEGAGRRPVRALITVQDVTEQREAEAALRQTDERFHHAASAARALVYEIDLAAGTTVVAHGLQEVFGYSEDPAGLSRDWWFERVHPDDLERQRAAIDGQRVAGDTRRVQYRVRHADGHWVPVDDYRAVVKGADGAPLRLVGTILDVSERAAAEDALREREQRLRDALDAGALGSWSYDLVRDEGAWDTRMYELYGRSPQLPPPRSGEFFERYVRPPHEGLESVQREHAGRGPTTRHEREFRAVRDDGAVRWLQSWEIAVHNEQGHIERVIGLTRDVTEEREAEELLREREQRLREALDAGEFGSWSYDARTDSVEWDARMHELYGLPLDVPAPTPREFVEFLHPDEHGRAELEWEHRSDSAVSSHEREFRIRRADGRERWVQSWERVEHDASGALSRIVALSRDVTERHEAQELLREREQRLQEALDAGELGAWSYDIAADRSVWDARMYRLFGRLPEAGPPDAAGFLRYVHRDDLARFDYRANHPGPERVTRFEREFRIAREDGVLRWMQSWEIAERGADGRIATITGLMRDVTERHEAEEALRRSEERLSILANLAPTFVWIADAEGTIVFTSERWLEYTGLTFEENLRWPERVVHPDDLERVSGAWAHAIATGEEYRIELRNRRHDGEYRWMETRAVPVRDEHGVITSWLGATTDIHERWLSEQRMRDNEERLRLALEVGDLGTFRVDVVDRAVTWGERARRMLRIEDDASVETFFERVHPDDRERAIAEVRASWQADAPETDHEGEYRFLWPDGSLRWIHRRWRVFFDGEGPARRPARAVVTVQDVTERRLAEEALRQSEEQRRLALEAGALGTWSFDLRTGVFNWDARMRELWDLAPGEEPSAELMMQRTHPDDRPAPAELEDLRKGAPEQAEHEFRIVRRDGEVRWLLSVGRSEYDDAGVPLRTTGYSRDITARKRAEQGLRQREQELKVALELGELGTVTRERGAPLMEMDGRARQIYGLGADEEALPSMILERTHPDDRERLQADQERAWDPASGGFFEGEYRIVWPDGTVRWVIRRVLVTFEGEGDRRHAVRGIATLRDVTEQRRLETAQREFMAMASHELRNPLAALTGNAQLLLRRGEFDRESAEVIVAQARHLERLVRDLLDVTAATAGQFRLRRSAVDLVHVAREIAAEQQATAPLHRVHVRRAPSSVRGMWDEDRLQQVVRNLVSNAIKYSPDGGEVAIDIDADEHEVHLSVEDHGVGIAEAEQERIFQRFYRSEPETGRIEGLGLGLDVTRALVEAHGGRISVTSSPGMGSTFTVRLPLGSAFATATGGGEARPVNGDGQPRAGRVLVADDDPGIRRLLTTALAAEGYEVTAAADGVEVLAALEAGQFAALLLDMMMPRLDGPGVVRELRRRELATDVPIVIVSASHAARTLGDQLEVAAVVEKPFDLEKLVATLQRVTGRR